MERREQAREGPDEAELAKRLSEGDDEAFEKLYELYFDKVYGFVMKRVGHRPTAEDIVSKVFMKAFAGRKRFVPKPSFQAWIYRIAQNAITDHYRAQKYDEELDPARHDSGQGGEAERGVDVKILRKELEIVIEKLPERDRLVLTMKFYGEQSNGEIADALGLTPNNVGVILHRALKKCQKRAPDVLKTALS